jgi:hypothetical protein
MEDMMNLSEEEIADARAMTLGQLLDLFNPFAEENRHNEVKRLLPLWRSPRLMMLCYVDQPLAPAIDSCSLPRRNA